MDVVGSEIGQKMRSAIKAKLTELGCYVDDELPDYVMVMVANKRTRSQMDEDLQLFLGDNTELFVNWLHQVLKKLQEVQITTPLKGIETEKIKDTSKAKDKKVKEKKEKDKKIDVPKKAKKKEKERVHKKKEDKKVHKNKKKSKHHDMIRPNVPPLLMNIEKESEPSITDVFAGQILKNHGINLNNKKLEQTSVENKRPIIPIIDPATIQSHSEPVEERTSTKASAETARDEQIKEVHEIEVKICGLKKKLAYQLDTISDDEDFLNIRTEAEELLTDFADDVFQEISKTAPVTTPPLALQKSPTPSPPIPTVHSPKTLPEEPIEILPQIELNLPKRSIRERLGTWEHSKEVADIKGKDKITATLLASPERLTPERQPEELPAIPVRRRLGGTPELPQKTSMSEDSLEKSEQTKRLTSKVSVLENRQSRVSCASVVRVRPRPRVTAPASSLLMKAVADAHKSLLNAPPKIESDHTKPKRALVLPMRRCVDAQNIVIQVPRETPTDTNSDIVSSTDFDSDGDDKSIKQTISVTVKEDCVKPVNITKVINNTPSRTASRKDDTLIIETINIHNPTIDKDKDTQFIVTMDGYLPNAFLAKKLMMEGLLDEQEINKNNIAQPAKSVLKTKDSVEENNAKEKVDKLLNKEKPPTTESGKKESCDKSDTKDDQKKRLSEVSDESDTQVIIKEEEPQQSGEQSIDLTIDEEMVVKLESPPAKKRKASPIVFNVVKKEKETERVRERTQSASSDSHVIVTTSTTSHKYDSVPPLSLAERKLVWCRSFPLCRFGSACAFAHPRCKFAASCTRRGCVYSHALNEATPLTTPPVLASHVVPAANYKSISSASVGNLCKYYPNCVNPACHYYHPKPCRYGQACINKLECNFFHNDTPSSKWNYLA